MQLALQQNAIILVAISIIVVAIVVLTSSAISAATINTLLSLRLILVYLPLFVYNNTEIEADKLDYVASVRCLTLGVLQSR
jgi:hypothetical protein